MNTPTEVIDQLIGLGEKKYKTPWLKLIILGMLAGVYIATGGLLASLSAAGFGAWSEGNPFLPKLLAGITFPVGLILVVLVGAELFTGNTAYLMPATITRRIPSIYFVQNWAVVFAANLVGALLFDYFLVYKAGIMQAPAYADYIRHVAEYKVGLPWDQVLLRGIGANWLVCLAVWLGFASRSMVGRLVGIWWPVMAFVAIGFEHSIANMFYIPTGMLYGANVSWGAFILDNLIPSTLGNIIGGTLFVGCMYTYLYSGKRH